MVPIDPELVLQSWTEALNLNLSGKESLVLSKVCLLFRKATIGSGSSWRLWLETLESSFSFSLVAKNEEITLGFLRGNNAVGSQCMTLYGAYLELYMFSIFAAWSLGLNFFMVLSFFFWKWANKPAENRILDITIAFRSSDPVCHRWDHMKHSCSFLMEHDHVFGRSHFVK